MDSFKANKKLQVSMNSSYNKTHFLHNLILSSMVAITCSFLCSYPFWFSSLTTSIKHFAFISLPTICSSFLNPKCLFIVFNVIVAFLVGESKLLGSSSSSQQSSLATHDIYSEYVERSQSLHGQKRIITSSTSTIIPEEKEELQKLEIIEKEENVYEEEEGVVLDQVEYHDEEEKHDHDDDDMAETKHFKENSDDGGEDESADGLLPTEELNKRVEEFIARINKQRWLEAKMMICCQA
jgi:hypothetical protein|uniref:DUF4408 domain-containing protein n=1 Tax=Cannabis sativa TaxID=3483 RepID=A0A803QYE6_CANSA